MMKRICILLASMSLLVLLASCEKELVPYNDPICRLNFQYWDDFTSSWMTTEDLEGYSDDSYSTTSYSFIYEGITDRDTLWFQIRTSGFLSDQPRPIALQQITVPDTVDNAESGVHYVPFDSPELAAAYTVPANTDTLRIPVILLRDPSLETKDVVLRFGFAENDYFEPGFKSMSYRTIYISARLSQPTLWESYYFGEWGPVKHQLMIEWTGETWDDSYLTELYNGDSGYIYYMAEWFSKKLEEENEKRAATGLEPYTEADGTLVAFAY